MHTLETYFIPKLHSPAHPFSFGALKQEVFTLIKEGGIIK